MKPGPLKLRELAYGEFTQRLLSSDIKPGQFISQRELAELTGLPLGAIRELIPRLEVEGLIVTVPQRGMQVAQVDLALIRSAFQFRQFLEVNATTEFVRRASDDNIARLREAHERIIARARSQRDATLIADAEKTDQDLHETIIDHLENEIISKAYRVNWIKTRLIRQSSTRLYDDLVLPVMMEHMAVIRAIEARDASGAAEAMAAHIESARRRAIDISG